jgi:hypothetical protein
VLHLVDLSEAERRQSQAKEEGRERVGEGYRERAKE